MNLTHSLWTAGQDTYIVLNEQGDELSNPLPRDKAVDLVRRFENGAHFGDLSWTMLTPEDNTAVAGALGLPAEVTPEERERILAIADETNARLEQTVRFEGRTYTLHGGLMSFIRAERARAGSDKRGGYIPAASLRLTALRKRVEKVLEVDATTAHNILRRVR